MKATTVGLAGFFKALSDPTRFRLVRLLAERRSAARTDECGRGPLCVNALARRLRLTQSAVSQHLRILRHAGLVRGSRKGVYVHYSLDVAGLGRRVKMLQDTLGLTRSR
jgi:ArsR family transcriptional regulator, arsenate/arsenite/antimonite-responsive transcriptional repressor